MKLAEWRCSHFYPGVTHHPTSSNVPALERASPTFCRLTDGPRPLPLPCAVLMFSTVFPDVSLHTNTPLSGTRPSPHRAFLWDGCDDACSYETRTRGHLQDALREFYV